MKSRVVSLALAGLLSTACAAQRGDGADRPSTAELKAEARASLAGDPKPDRDPCAVHGWYGDGECDDFCPQADDDCQLACPTLFSRADGECDESDPCSPFTDEDCQDPTDACVIIATQPDGVCDRSIPCWDPECDASVCADVAYPKDGSCDAVRGCEARDPDCLVENPSCRELQHPADGVCTAPAGCDSLDVDCTGSVACIEIAYATNGKCEAARGCEYTDPRDCAIVCPTIDLPRDGVCSGSPCDEDC
jgi:hypothetical protein